MNRDLLKNKIEMSGIKLKFISEKLGITYQGFKRKLDGDYQFTEFEIKTLKSILNLSDKEILDIFF